MQYAKSTDYALHALVYLASAAQEYKIGINELADKLDVSESYLSKIMTQLRKDGIVKGVPGVKGGYKLSRPAGQITFLDVILSTEGRQEMFNCSNLESRQHTSIENSTNSQSVNKKGNSRICRIKEVMDNAESTLHHFLDNQTIQSILEKANKDCNNPTSK